MRHKRTHFRKGQTIFTSDGRERRFLRPERGGRAWIEDPKDGTIEVLPAAALRSERDRAPFRVTEFLALPAPLQEEARRRHRLLRPLLKNDTYSRSLLARIAVELGVHPATLYRWLRWYRNERSLLALVPRKRGPEPGQWRLPPEIEEILLEKIEHFYATGNRPTIKETTRQVALDCSREHLPAPGEGTVRRRLRTMKNTRAIEQRRNRERAGKRRAIRGHFEEARRPLELLQIDHTKMDIQLVDRVDRMLLARPWVTLAIDVYSRMVVGFYLSFDPPSATSVALCIAHAINGKEEWLSRFPVQSPWPVWGVPDRIHCDNAREFHGRALESGCSELGIDLEFRPPHRPHFGGHIERLIGNLLGTLHICPGTTFSNPTERGSYPSEKLAAMTLAELEAWFTIQVVDLYHNTTHRQLGISPLEMWERGICGDGKSPGRGLIDRVESSQDLLLGFLPLEERTVQRDGISWDELTYWDPRLTKWVLAKEPGNERRSRRFLVRRDPRDLKVIYFWDPEERTYLTIPLMTGSAPGFSIWDLRAARKMLRERGERKINETRILAALNERRQIEERAVSGTRAARLLAARREKAEANERAREAARASVPPKPAKGPADPGIVIVEEDVKPFPTD